MSLLPGCECARAAATFVGVASTLMALPGGLDTSHGRCEASPSGGKPPKPDSVPWDGVSLGPGMWPELTSPMSLPSTWNPEGRTQRIMDPLEQWPSTFLAPEAGFLVEDSFFHGWWAAGRDGFRRMQVLYIYYALYFLYYHISSPSDHQALDLGSWGLLP